MSDYPSDWPGFPESENMLRVERPISDDHHDSDRSTAPDLVVAEMPC